VNWIVLIVVGGVVGWLASLVMKTDGQMGILANVLVGIIGSSLGAWIAAKMQIGATGAMVYVVAVLGAIVLIALLKVLGIFK
jgi:uncharacterized membrane protein YeaQ/YmgE (transglycosylase-associated protein family)